MNKNENKTEEKWFDLNDRDFNKNNIDEKQAIYRILPFDSLLQMFNERANYLVKINQWEDKYENFILKERYIIHNKEYNLEKISERFYGQCWTTKKSSDAMWRIYSPDKKSVRIQTRVGKLKDLLKQDKNGEGLVKLVKYHYLSKIEKDLLDITNLKQSDISTLIMQSLFVKRYSFNHESECRIVVFAKSDPEILNKPIIKFDIDPLDFIENIQFDPRADIAYISRCRKILSKMCKYPSKKMYKSTLYKFSPITLTVVD